jgi:hypothetical protein
MPRCSIPTPVIPVPDQQIWVVIEVSALPLHSCRW